MTDKSDDRLERAQRIRAEAAARRQDARAALAVAERTYFDAMDVESSAIDEVFAAREALAHQDGA